MFSSRPVCSDHKDLIHDVAYDWYGMRLATCSSDQTVKVWDFETHSQEWKCSASWKCHSGSVWKVTWAHPEFGQVLATCSFDRTASVWEEIPWVSKGDGHGGVGGGVNSGGGNHWVKKTSLVDSRTSVTDIKFAPRHLGLQLATCSNDGTVRIYEAPDVMNLNQWSLKNEITCKLPCSCITWNQSLSRSHAPMIAVGSDGAASTASGKVFIYEFNESLRRWTRVETFSMLTDPVHDIAFAPNIGRSYHVLAIATKDLRIITLKPTSNSAATDAAAATNANAAVTDVGSAATKYDIRLAGQSDEHVSTVWRVCWNVTGTILASSGDDGQVRLWKADYLDNWKCVATLRGDGQATQPGIDAALGKQGYFNLPAQMGSA